MGERMNNLTGKEWLQFSFTIWRDIVKTSAERATKHPALFPQELVERLIRLYLRNPGSVVLDPFMGIGSTVLAAMNQGMAPLGFDLSEDFCDITTRRVEDFKLTGDSKIHVIQPKIFNKDSRELSKSIDANSVDLVVTSPPYWDILNMKRTADGKIIRNYSDDISDLGNIADYDAFLADLKVVFTEVHEVLKPGARCISVVMDIRKKDKFFPLHEDQTRIMKEIGFELDEYVIWDRQRDYNNMKTLGYPYVYRFNRVHEFICIYQKKKAEPVKKVVKKKAEPVKKVVETKVKKIAKVSKEKIIKDSLSNKVAGKKAL